MRLVVDVTVSVDGFVAGRDPDAEHPLGVGGDCLRDWIRNGASAAGRSSVDGEVLRQVRGGFGAYVMGRKTFEVVPLLGLQPDPAVPCYVVSHGNASHRSGSHGNAGQGIREVFEMAAKAAGDRPVGVVGSASVARQYLRAGLVDELRLHVVPALLGSGIRLFDSGVRAGPVRLLRTGAIDSPYASHVKFRVLADIGPLAGS